MPKILQPGEEKVLFNCKISPDLLTRMKIVCFRRSVHRKKKFSEGALVSGYIASTKLPRCPTAAEIEEYIALYPKKREEIMAMAALPPPRI